MANHLTLTVALLGLLLAPSGLTARGQGKGGAKGHDNGKLKVHAGDHGANPPATKGFGVHDRDVILRFFQGQPGGLPPGLAKRSTLPPGLEKQLRRKGRLPRGLEDQIEPFPAGLAVRFPTLEPGYKRGFLHGTAIIYQPGGLIVDLIDLR